MLFSSESRRDGESVVWIFLIIIILAKILTALWLNSEDWFNCVVQGAAQHRCLTRTDAAARSTWFVWMAAGWRAALTLCIIHPVQLPPKDEKCQFPMVNTDSDGSSASLCLVHGRPCILVLPGNPVWFSIRFCCQLMGVFDLALLSINLCKKVSVQDKTLPDS